MPTFSCTVYAYTWMLLCTCTCMGKGFMFLKYSIWYRHLQKEFVENMALLQVLYQQQKCPVKRPTSRYFVFVVKFLKWSVFFPSQLSSWTVCIYPMVKFLFACDCQASMQAGSYDAQCYEYISTIIHVHANLGSEMLILQHRVWERCVWFGVKQTLAPAPVSNNITAVREYAMKYADWYIYIYIYLYWFLPLSASLPCF